MNKFKKIVSVIASAAMTAQLGIVLPLTASAAIEQTILWQESFDDGYTAPAGTEVIADPTNADNSVLKLNQNSSVTMEGALPAEGGTYSMTADVYYPMALPGNNSKGYDGATIQATTGADAGFAFKAYGEAKFAYVGGGGSGAFGDFGIGALNQWYTIRLDFHLIGTAQKSVDVYVYNKADYDANGTAATPVASKLGAGFRNAGNNINTLKVGLAPLEAADTNEYSFYIDNMKTFTEFDPGAEEAVAYVEATGMPDSVISVTEDTDYNVAVKVVGERGGDLTDTAKITWETAGLSEDDGYVLFEGMEEDSPSFTMTVREGVGNYFGKVTAHITVGDYTTDVVMPFAIVGRASADANQLFPPVGYPTRTDDYDDTMVGYQIKATSDTYKDLVLGGWSIYGSNGARTLTLMQDDTGKYLEFSKGGGTSGSTVGVYDLGNVGKQFIVDTQMRFVANTTIGYHDKTPNNANTTAFAVSYTGGVITSGSGSISGLENNKWYRLVLSCDTSVGTYSVWVYDGEELLGEILDQATTQGTTSPRWIAVSGDFPVNLKDMTIYTPVASAMQINTSADTIQVPESGEANIVDVAVAVQNDEGIPVTGATTIMLDQEYANVELISTGAQSAQLKVNPGASSGDIKIIASRDGVSTEKTVKLTTSSNGVAFTKGTSSITIPFDGEESVVAEYAAETRDGQGNPIDGGAITYELLKADNTPANIKGVTFENGILTVAAGASPAVVYVRATNEEGLSARYPVNIHGLNFQFTSGEAEEGYTQVTNTSLYTDTLGYGFTSVEGLTADETAVTGASAYTFKAKVPNGNYEVTVDTTSTGMLSEAVDGTTATGISKVPSKFSVAVCDGVLDLTFNAESSISSLGISQIAAKSPLSKPAIYAIGDSTTKNGDANNSWGEVAGGLLNTDVFSGFQNHGMAGRNSVNFYNQGRVEAVLLNMNPGDYVTINMGINWGDEADYATLLENYYVNAVLQRGGNPVILTATPQGPVRDGVGNYNEETGEFNCDRGDGARNAVLRSIAAKYDLPLIELGNWGDDYFNSLTDEDVQNEALWGPYRWNESRDTATTGDTPITSKLELVSSWYGDHNHYTSPFAETVASYILGELEDMVLNAPVLTVTVGEITLNGNTATVPVTVENGSAPINAYVAQYADGTLVSIDAVSNAEVTGTQNIKIPFEVADGAETIKVMVWDNAQQQYCDVFSDSIEYPEA